MGIRESIKPPYFFTEDHLPGIDFNREIVEPGKNKKFPKGAVGIRADDDFWVVAALPLSYRKTPLAKIVRELWPQYADEAKLCPDSGSVEQRVYFSESYAESKEYMNKHLEKVLGQQTKELDRLRAGRSDLHEHHVKRKHAEDSYFIRQYEHLLVAMAHKNVPREDAMKGICSICGLLGTDRVHDLHYIELHDKGYDPSARHLTEFERED